ncbi:hypothetical protein [Cerasicoccus maritimus]|uniref:hypothetical protein n=1 Tax=Cerasicoccus maritimus TaxID=490089 RepID=UPI002852CB87|nr:hypothetical protein [Cerasicoccus maritimus]
MDDKPSKITYIIWLLRNWFVDAWFFCRGMVRNSAPNFLYRFWDFITYNCSSFFQWFRTLGARRKVAQSQSRQTLSAIPHALQSLWLWLKTINVRAKVAQQERREAAERLGMGARAGVHQFYSFIIDVLKSPIRFICWLGFLYKILRSMSLRAALKEAWGGYREFVERTFEHALLLVYQFLDARWWIRASIILLFIGSVSAVILGPWALRSFKDYRSMQVYAEAKQLQEENRLVEAYVKSRTAAMLNLDNPETLDLVIELGEATMNPESVWWAERKAIAVDYSEESLLKVIELASKAGFPEIGQKHLYLLRQKFPDSPGVTDSQLRLLMSMHMSLEAFQLAEQAEARGEDSITMHLIIVSNGINTPKAEVQAKLIKYLQKHLYRNDEVGFAIQMHILMSTGSLSQAVVDSIDYGRLLEVIQDQVEAKPNDIAVAIGYAMLYHAITREEAIEALADLYDLNDPAQREQALIVATQFELYDLMDRLEPEQIENANHQLKRLVFGPTPDLEAAQSLIDQPDKNALSQSQEHFWQAMIAASNQQFNDYANHIRLALQFSGDPEAIYEMQSIILNKCSHEQIMEYWRSAFRFFPESPEILFNALIYTYTFGADQQLKSFVSQMPLTTFKNNPAYQQFLIYLKALDGVDLATCRKEAESLIMQHPKDSIYYIILAFCYEQSNEPRLAQAVLGSFELGSDYEKMPPYLRLCLVACGVKQAAPDVSTLPQKSERQLLEKKMGLGQ